MHLTEEPFTSPILRIIRKSKVFSFSAVLKQYDLPEVSPLLYLCPVLCTWEEFEAWFSIQR